MRFRWHKCCLEMRRPCTAKVIVGSGWKYNILSSAIRHWSTPDEVLLVDVDELYNDYFVQTRKERNKERVNKIVKIFR